MGILDLPAPVFGVLDETLAMAFPPFIRIAVWALLGSAISMLLYWWLSPQHKISDIKRRATAARMELASYDGEFDGLLRVAMNTIGLSFRQIGIVLGPTLLASLPLLCLLVWISNVYGLRLPAPGDSVSIQTLPLTAPVSWRGGSASPADAQGHWAVPWPSAEAPVRLEDSEGGLLVSLPVAMAIPVIHKRQWWNALIANPAGYLPDDALLDRVDLQFPALEVIAFGPSWLRSWEASFLTLLVIFSVSIKLVFRIH